MKAFIIFAIVLTVAYVIYYTVIIAHDNARLRKTEREYIELRQWVQEQSEGQANR